MSQHDPESETPAPDPDALPPGQTDDADVVAQNLRHVQFERCAEALHVTACGFGKVVDLTIDQVPRLLTSAACRTVESLIENYERAHERERMAGRVDYVADKQRREMIAGSLLDLIGAFEEGLTMAHKIRASITPKASRG